MKWAVLAAVLALGCTDDAKTLKALDAMGFTEVRLTGHVWFGCAKDDSTCTGFVAKGPTGKTVRGAVGCGLMMKACTVRIEGAE